MSRTCDTLELLVDFLTGDKREQDIPPTKASSSVESVTAANIRSSAIAEQQAAAAAAQESARAAAAASEQDGGKGGADQPGARKGGDTAQDQHGDGEDGDSNGGADSAAKSTGVLQSAADRRKRAAAAAAAAMDDDDDEEDDFAAAALMGGIETKGASQQNARRRPSSASKQHQANGDGGEAMLPRLHDENDDDEERGEDDGEDDDDGSLSAEQRLERARQNQLRREKAERERAVAHLRKVEVVIVRLSPSWAAGVSGFWMDQWQERALYRLRKEFGAEATAERAKQHRAEMQRLQEQREQLLSAQQQPQQQAADPLAAAASASMLVPQPPRGVQLDAALFTSSTRATPNSPLTAAAPAAATVSIPDLPPPPQDLTLDVSLEICTLDAKLLLAQIVAMAQQHEKRAEALRARDAALKQAAIDAELRRREQEAAAIAAAERQKRRKRGQTRGPASAPDAASPADALGDTMAAADEAAAAGLLEATTTSNSGNNRTNPSLLHTLNASRIPAPPPVSLPVLRRLLLLLRPWADAAQPTYLIFKRRVAPAANGNNESNAATAASEGVGAFSDAAAVLEQLAGTSSFSFAGFAEAAPAAAEGASDSGGAAAPPAPLLRFQFVAGVEGVDVPVIEDTLTRMCNTAKLTLASAMAKIDATTSSAPSATRQTEAADFQSSLKAFHAFSPTTTTGTDAPAESVANAFAAAIIHGGGDDGSVELNAKELTEGKDSASAAAAAGVAAGAATAGENDVDDDEFYSDSDDEGFGLDDIEADETQKALLSAIEVLEIAQRSQQQQSASDHQQTSWAQQQQQQQHQRQRFDGGGSGSGLGKENSDLGGVATPAAFRGTNFKYPAAHNPDRKAFAVPRPPPTVKPTTSRQQQDQQAPQHQQQRALAAGVLRAQQQSMAALPEEVLQRRQRTTSLGEYMQQVNSGMFDMAGKKMTKTRSAGGGGTKPSFVDENGRPIARIGGDEDDDGDVDDGDDDVDDDDDDDDDGGDFFDKSDKAKAAASAAGAVHDVVKSLFRDHPTGANVAFDDAPLSIMSAEERLVAEAAMACKILGPDALRQRQQQHKLETRSLLRLFPRTHRARSAAAFIIQCRWRKLCQWRRIGVVIDGVFLTHAEAAAMRRAQRVKRLQARREALLQAKISEVLQRLWRGSKAKLVLAKLQRHAASSLKISNEYAKRRSKRSSVYCTSSAAYGQIPGIPLPPPFDRKALLLAQLERMRAQWVQLCKSKEREMLEESFILPSSPLRTLRAQLAGRNAPTSLTASTGQQQQQHQHSTAGDGVALGVSKGDAGGDAPSIAALIADQPCSAGAAAAMVLGQAVDRPQSVLPPASLALLTTTMTSSAGAMMQAVAKAAQQQKATAAAAASSGMTQESSAMLFGAALKLQPQFPGNKVSPFGVVAAALVAVQQQQAAAAAKAAAMLERSKKRKSTGADPAASAVDGRSVSPPREQQQQQQQHKVSSLEILANVELLLPRQLFAPEATWIEVRWVLLSKMNEEEFRIITTKCLCPRA